VPASSEELEPKRALGHLPGVPRSPRPGAFAKPQLNGL